MLYVSNYLKHVFFLMALGIEPRFSRILGIPSITGATPPVQYFCLHLLRSWGDKHLQTHPFWNLFPKQSLYLQFSGGNFLSTIVIVGNIPTGLWSEIPIWQQTHKAQFLITDSWNNYSVAIPVKKIGFKIFLGLKLPCSLGDNINNNFICTCKILAIVISVSKCIAVMEFQGLSSLSQLKSNSWIKKNFSFSTEILLIMKLTFYVSQASHGLNEYS